MEAQIKELLVSNSQELFGQQIPEGLIQFQKTRKDVEGDLTLVTFPFVKMLKMSPQDVGETIGRFIISKIDDFNSYNVIGGFLNIVISDDYWLNILLQIDRNDNYGFSAKNSKPTLMVEYSSPNTNKPLHLGHLRNNFLGYSVARILDANGHNSIKTQIINDRGIHICKSMLAWERFSPINESGERENPLNTGVKGDKLVGKYYVEFDKHFNSEAKEIITQWESGSFEDYTDDVIAEFQRLEGLKEGKDEKSIKGIDAKIKDLAKNQTQLLNDAKEMLLKWEARDPEVYLLWSTMNGWVYEGFAQTYERMGVEFDQLYYESDTFILGKELVLEGLEKGIFFKKTDGSVWIDLSDEGLDEKLVLRSDGTAVYMTQDMGTAVDRYKDYSDLDGIIYTVGNEQDYHFKVLFLILKKLGYHWAENCYHLSYGMVDLPTGRMKSREGTVVDADDLITEVVQKAKEMTQERGHIEGMSDDEREELYETIGLGGLKYYLLKVDPKKRMMFNPEESIELNGNTGPFIQYAHARIRSLISKGGAYIIPSKCELQSEEKELIKLIFDYPIVVKEAGLGYSPAIIANYTYELVKSYNHFYQSITILGEEDLDKRNLRLGISSNVARIIKSSMGLLGIKVPERM